MSGAAPLSARLSLMLTELRVPTIKRVAPDLCQQADKEGWPGQRLLEALMEHELAQRETRRIDRHRAEANLSPDKRLSNFDFSAVPSVSKAQVIALAEGHEWLGRGANVLLFGSPGVGKSHLVSGLCHALIEAGRRVYFSRCSVSGKPATSFPHARCLPRMPASTTTARRATWKEEDAGRTWARPPGGSC